MKRLVLVLSLGLIVGFSSLAQEQSIGDQLGFGFQINQFQQDFGLGINLTSPFFIHKTIAVRLRGNLMWNEHPDAKNEITWTSYSNVSLGVASVAGQIADRIRLYGEGGVIVLLPSEDFSSASSEIGGYGIFGFEFFMGTNVNYFIEMGGIGTGARADKIVGKPIYSNGFLMSVGVRGQL